MGVFVSTLETTK